MADMVRFGIAGPGTIARKFARAAKKTEGVRVAAVASTDPAKAQALIDEVGLDADVCTREELYTREDIDAVYISLINPLHFDTAMAAIRAGKAVLCEKPMCLTAEQTESLIHYAEEQKVLLMEGLWTLFLPATKKAHEWIDSGKIGKLQKMESSFCFHGKYDPKQRLYDPEKGGGALYDVGIYTLSYSMDFGDLNPELTGTKFTMTPSGVDSRGTVNLTFADGMEAEGRFATLHLEPQDGYFEGTEGAIKVPNFWKAEGAKLLDAKGKVVEKFEEPEENGFVYEIAAFRDAFLAGKLEVAPATHAMSAACARLIDAALAKRG